MPNNNWNASLYDQKHAFVFAYGQDLISLLDPQPGERILDLGCGTGHLTKTIGESGAHVIGIDNSESMVDAARKSYPDREFHVIDARNFSFPYAFDAVFSNAVLHWIPEADQVATCISRSLKSGGRFVAEFGGKGNIAHIINAIQESVWELLHVRVNPPWYYPSLGEYAALLEKHQLAVHSAALFDRPTKLEEGEKGMRNWLTMFATSMFLDIPDDVKQQVLERIEAKLLPILFKDGTWTADYKRLRVVAHKE